MSPRLPLLLMIGPSLDARGGIAQICERMCSTDVFEKLCGKYISSYIEGNVIYKVTYFLYSLFRFVLYAAMSRNLVVYIHSSSRTSFWRKSFFIIISRVLRKKVIIHIHPSHFRDFVNNCDPIKKKLILSILDKCNAVVTLTQSMRDFIRTCLPEKQVYVLPNPIDFQRQRSRSQGLIVAL